MAEGFNDQMNEAQRAWRPQHIETREQRTQNRHRRPWILPRRRWEEGLWPGIRSGSEHTLSAYIEKERVQKHPGFPQPQDLVDAMRKHLLSAPARPQILATFPPDRIDRRIVKVQRLELERTGEYPLDPTTLLDEPKGRRGANQTSPDIGVSVGRECGGQGLVLTENKFVEHSFYRCSGRKKGVGKSDTNRCPESESDRRTAFTIPPA